MAAVNSQKGRKTASSNYRNRLKFGKISRQNLLCSKMKRTGYRKFHHSGTLSLSNGSLTHSLSSLIECPSFLPTLTYARSFNTVL